MTRYLRAELMLPLVIVVAAAMVAASEFMTTFEFTAGGEPQDLSSAADRHSYALLILAVLAVVGMTYAIATGIRAAAVGTAVLGVATLLLFLLLDLPDAGKAGPLDDQALYFADARADPDTGFWLEAVGTVVLGLATVAFATLSSAQLRAPAELLGGRREKTGEQRTEKTEKREVFDSEKEASKVDRAAEPKRKPKQEPKPKPAAKPERGRPKADADRKSRREALERSARERSASRRLGNDG